VEFRRLSPTPFSHAILSTSLSSCLCRSLLYSIISLGDSSTFVYSLIQLEISWKSIQNANELALTFFEISANEVDLERSELKVAGCGHLSFIPQFPVDWPKYGDAV
jgi:hypothetical protein